MSNVSDFGLGEMHEFSLTAERAGIAPHHINKLTKDVETLVQLRRVIEGYSTIVLKERYVDLEARPFVPEGLELVAHIGQGLWDSEGDYNLHVQSEQYGGISGLELRNQLTSRPDWRNDCCYNANVLDHLLAHQDRIRFGRGYKVFFWKTLYAQLEGGHKCVRFMYSESGVWKAGVRKLSEEWHDYDRSLSGILHDTPCGE